MHSTLLMTSLEEGISYFGFSLAVFHVPYSSANDATHREQHSVTTNSQGVSHCVHVVVHATAHHILNPLEILAKKETVKSCY